MARSEALQDLMRLALQMQGSAAGVTLSQIVRDFGVSRRTAERMRDVLLNCYPQIEEWIEDGQKHWRFPPGTLGRMEEPTLDDMAALHRAMALAEREGDLPTVQALNLLSGKLLAQLSGPRRSRVAPDLEAQMLADGVAFRPGPREKIPPETLSKLRTAIMAGVMIEADHRGRKTGKLSRNNALGPVALLFGEGRQYLLAWSEYQQDLRLFSLIGFERIQLSDTPYQRPEGFDLDDWLAQSFGVWREEPRDVVWRFLPEVADEAATYQFHPRQECERQPDGSLIVRFRAGGRQEMDWYLYRWGDKVEVVTENAAI